MDKIVPRACDCSFCRVHGAKTWSDPAGEATIDVAESDLLQRYRFALRTTEFYLCRVCGAYAGAVIIDGADVWATLNLRLTDLHALPAIPASYGRESARDRSARRKRLWTPTKLVGVSG